MMKLQNLAMSLRVYSRCLTFWAAVLLLGINVVSAAPTMENPAPVQAPPPAQPPIQGSGKTGSYELKSGTATLWSIGQPTDEEQQYLEYLNRARMNPTVEGQLLATNADPDLQLSYAYFEVDLPFMISSIATNPPVQPLAMNAHLTAAARFHTGDMFTNVYQGHVGTGGDTVADRLENAGYPYSTAAENVYSYSSSVLHGHAGFEVDWGDGPGSVGGMQNPPGHRNNIHYAGFREVGIGVINGTYSSGINSVGPQLVTQDFGTRGGAGNVPMITGVAYYDFNGNNFYDLGEGIGGLTVDVPGSSYYAVTAESGGYTIPVTTNGNYSVTFAGGGLTNHRVVTVSGLKNVKVDYLPAYNPPVITGPAPAIAGRANTYGFQPVGAATSYDWRSGELTNYSLLLGAESGLANVTVSDVPPNHSTVTTTRAASGAASYRFGFTNGFPHKLTLDALFFLSSTSQLSFAKLLTYATTGQVAKAQISLNEGMTWTSLWEQPGNDGQGETTFSTNNISLGAYAGKTAKIRFMYDYAGGPYFVYTNSGVGFYLDNIVVSNARQVINIVTNSSGTNQQFSVTPGSTNSILLQARAHISSRTLEWGPAATATVVLPAPSLQILATRIVAGQVQVDFSVADFRSGMTFQLHKSSSGGSWAPDTTATLTTLVSSARYRLTSSISGAGPVLYRVRGLY
jgi:hypothetical protein